MAAPKSQSGSSEVDMGPVTPVENLATLRSVASISMSPEMFEKLYLSPPNAVKGDLRKTFGNPTPMGLAGLLLALMPLTAALMGWRGSSNFAMNNIPAYFFLGGVLMVISGILEWILGNTFPATVFTSLGSFNLSFGGMLHPAFAAFSSYAPPDAKSAAEGSMSTGFNAGMGFFMVAAGVLSFIFLICALRTNIAFVIMFLAMVPAMFLMAAAFWTWAEDYEANTALALKLCKACGALLFVTCVAGWYVLLAILLAVVDFPIQIPVGDLSNVIKGRSAQAPPAGDGEV